MTKEYIEEQIKNKTRRFRVGQQVKVVSETCRGFNSQGKMDGYLGKNVTISDTMFLDGGKGDNYGGLPYYKIKEDGKRGIWFDWMFA